MDLGIPGLSDFEEIGSGGFSRVYRAREEGADRPVAVKVLNSRVDSESALRRFEREARAAGKLSDHPNVVPLHASGVTRDGNPYLVLDFLPGGSLGERVLRTGALPLAQVIAIGIKLSGALETAHRAGIFHRDVKPENVLLSRYGEPQLTDFGIASVVGGYETRSGFFSLSLAHAPPEVIAAQPGFKPSPTADVYSLGSTLYTLLTGQSAFAHHEGELLPALIARIVSEPIPNLRDKGVPDQVAAVVEKAMAKSPADRHQRIADVGYGLTHAAAALGIAVRPPVIEGDEVDTLDLGNPAVAPPAFTTTDPGTVSASAAAPLLPEAGDATVGLTSATFDPGIAAARPILPIPVSAPPLKAPPFQATPLKAPPLGTEPVPAHPSTPPRRRGVLVPVLAIVALVAVGAGVAMAMTRGDKPIVDPPLDDPTTTVAPTESTTTVVVGGGVELGSGEARFGEFTAEVSTPVFVGQEATFTVTGSPVNDDTVTWSFGDGSTATGASVTHTYTAARSTVAATVTVGSADPETLRFAVHEDPLAQIEIQGATRSGEAYVVGTTPVRLVSTSTGVSGDEVIYEWFIDGEGVSNASAFDWTFSTDSRERVVELRVRHDALESFYGTTDAFYSIARVIVLVFTGVGPPPTIRPTTPTTPTTPPTGPTTPTEPPPTDPPPTSPPTVAPQLVAVPNVVGDTRFGAIDRIQAAGLEFSGSSTTSCGIYAPDQVVSQSPSGGTLPIGGIVTITWCQ